MHNGRICCSSLSVLQEKAEGRFGPLPGRMFLPMTLKRPLGHHRFCIQKSVYNGNFANVLNSAQASEEDRKADRSGV